MLSILKQEFGFGEHLAKLLIPHPKNNHHPLLIRHYSLFLVAGLVVASQLVFNLKAGSLKVLGYATSIYQNEIVNLTNQQRLVNGVGTLTENSLLDQAAAKKANDMFAKDYWAHYGPDGTSPWSFFNAVGYKYIWAGENLAKDFQTSDGVVQGWMNSPSHRENLLNGNYTDIGVAVANGTLQGEQTTLVVQLFGRPLSLATTTTPTAQTATPKSVSDQLVLPQKTQGATASVAPTTKVSGEYSAGFNPVRSLENLPTAAKIELFLLLSIFLVFVVDSLVLARRRAERVGGHSFLHALVFALLIISVLVGSGGRLL